MRQPFGWARVLLAGAPPLGLALVCLALPGSAPAFDGWHGPVTPRSLNIHGGVYIIDTSSPLNDCQNGMPGRFVIAKDASLAKDMYATALAAFLTGRTLSV